VVIDGDGGANQPELLGGESSTVDTVAVSAGMLQVTGNLSTTTGLTISGSGVVTVNGPGSISGDAEVLTGGELTLDGDLTGNITNAGTLTILNAGSQVVGNVASSGTGANSGEITGTLGVTGGTFENAGIVGGATTVSGGELKLETGTNLGNVAALGVSGTGTLTVNAADTVGAVTQTGGTIEGAATLTATTFGQSGGDLAGTVSASGAKTLSGGTISGTLSGAGATTILTNSTTVTGSIVGNVTVGAGGTLRLDGANAVTGTITTTGSVVSYANAQNEASALIISSATTDLEVLGTDAATQSGVISSTGAFGFEKIGTGNLTVSGVNTYTGLTDVSAGTLTVSNDAGLGATGAGNTTNVDAGATLALTGVITVTEAITLNGTGVGNGGALRNVSGANVVDGEITLASNARINSDAGQGELNGNITGTDTNLTVGGTGITFIAGDITTGTGSLTVDATTAGGIVALQGANTFTGGTTVSSGFLQLVGGFALADGGALTVNSPGTVQVIDGETVGALSGDGVIALQTAEALVAGGAAGIATFSGQIIESGFAGTFTKAGAGTLILSGDNSYTGATTVNAGILNVTGNVDSTVVNVNTGGSLQVDGASLADAAAVTLAGTGNLTLTGSETIGSLAGTGGSVTLGANTLTTGNALNTSYAGSIAGTGGLTKVGTGTMALTGAISHSGTTTVSAGRLNIETFGTTRDIGDLVVNTGGTLGLDNASLSVDSLTGTGGTIAMTTTNGAASLTFGSDNSTGSFAGGITGDTALTDLIKEGNGTTTLSGVVNTAGAVTVSGGTLALSGNNTITGGVFVDGRLLLQHNNAAGGAGGMITTTGSVVSYANGVNSATPITIASNTTQLEVLAADAATQSGAIGEDAAGRPLEKIGTGTLTLSGVNTFTGNTTISAGTLIVTSGAALSDTGAVIIANGGTLTVNTNQETIGSLASSDVATSTAIVNNNAGLAITGAADTTFDGNITGAGQLTVFGGGTLTLTGANSHTGGMLAGLVAGSEIALTGGGTTASGTVAAAAGGLITTDGGALASNATLIVDSATATMTGSETISRLTGNGPPNFTGTVNLTGAATVLTLNGTTGASGIGGIVAGLGTLNVTGGTTTVAAAGDVQTATTIGASGTVVNNGTMAAVGNAGSFTNNLTAGALTNTGAGTGGNTGTLASLTHNSTGLFTNTGAVTGNTTVSNGTLTLSGLSNLSNTGTLNVTGGIVNVNVNETVGVLDADGGVTNVNAVLTAGELSGTAGSIVMTGGANGMVVGSANTSTTFGGVISGNGGFQKVGTGTLTLTGVNTFNPASSAVTLSGGVLFLDNAGSLAATSITIDANGRLTTDGAGLQTTAQINNGGTNVLGGLALIDGGDESIANLNGSGTVNLSSGSVLTLNTGASAIGGAISGAGGLTIAGTSATTLSAANTYSGATTVNAGSLTMAATGSITSATTINGGIVTNNGGGFASVNNITGTFNNTTGTAGAVTNAASGTNGGTIASLTNSGGNFTNSGTVSGASTVSGGIVTNALGTFASTLGLSGTGTFNNNAAVTGAVTVTGGTFTNVGTLASTLAVSGGVFDNNLGGVAGTTTNTGGTITNNGGTFAAVTNTTGTFNNTTGTAGAVTNAATGTNGGTIASLSNTGGTFGNSGTVTAASTITGGTVTNTGSMAGVTNSATYIATAATTGALVNTGTATVTGGTTASVANNAGTTTLAGATVTGAVTNTAGTVNTSGVTTAATVNNSATLGAAGTLNAVVTNNAGGTFTVAGLLDGGAKNFTNAGILNVVTASYGNIATFTNNVGGVVNLTGPQTLSAVTLNNVGGTIIMGGGSAIAGAFTNSAVLQASGTTQITGSFVNNGTVDLANGATGDILNITGATSGTGLYQIDLNLSNGTSDRINAPVGVAEIHLDFDTVGGGLLLPPITVFSGAAVGATLTQQDLPVGGAVLYSLTQAGNDVQVVSSINPAVSGVAASAAMTQSLISTVVNRPTSPFVSGLAAEEGCSNGGYFRASAGLANVQGTATSNSISSTSNISSRFSGVQGGYDIGCFDGRFFDGWDGALGVMAGYNSGSTNQNVFSDPINPTLQTGTSGSSFKQSYLGIYAAGSKDRFSGDLQLRFDQTEFDLKETALAGFEVGLDGINYTTNSTTVGTRLNYRMDVNEDKGINFVPTIGFNYTTVSGNVLTLDDMTTLSTADDETLTIDGYNTVVGFLGGTLAKTTIDPEGTAATTTFISGNYYQDFGGDRSASYDSSVLPGPEAITIGSIGGFAEASIGVNYVKILDKGPGGAKQLNANVRADARFGPNVSDSYSVTAQIRLSF
jgi:autotransporter-associated beta strand protein